MVASIAGARPVVAPVIRIAAEELPSQFSRTEMIEIGIMGRQTPIAS